MLNLDSYNVTEIRSDEAAELSGGVLAALLVGAAGSLVAAVVWDAAGNWSEFKAVVATNFAD